MDVAHRRAMFKKTLSVEGARRSRVDAAASLRKNKKIEALAKRRNLRTAAPVEVPTTAAPGTAIVVAPPAAPVALSSLQEHVAGIMGADPELQYKGTHAVRRMLSKEKDPPVKEVLATGVLPRLVEFLRNPNAELVFEAAWAITNIASTEYTSTVVEAGATPLFVNLLRSPKADVREQSIWCLGNIAGDGHALRDMVLSVPDAVNNLLLNIQHAASESLLRNATWTLSNYCRGKPAPPLEAVRPLIPALAHLLSSSDTEVLTDACWGLSYLTDGDDARIQAVVDAGVASRLVQLLSHASPTVIIPALRTAGNIVTGSDVQTQSIINAGGLAAFARLVNHDRRNIRREACWASSNVAAGTVDQIKAFVETPGLVDGLLNQLLKAEWAVRKEALWSISNALTSGGEECVHKLVAKGCIGPVVKILGCEDSKLIQIGLEAMAAVLEAGGVPGGEEYATLVEEAGGLDAFEELQEHSNTEIYDKAVSLIETYFGVDDGAEDENVAPAATSKGFAFGFPAAPPAAAAQPAAPFAFAAPAAQVGGNPFTFSS